MENKGSIGVDLAICILFYERLNQTIKCIKSFLSSGVNIYVLNNGSSSSARKALGRFCDRYKQIKIFDSNVNLGVGVGRNYLITHTSEEWLLLADNDTVVKTSDWLQIFTQYVSLYKDIEAFIPRIFNVREYCHYSYPPFRIVGSNVIRERKVVNDLTNNFPGTVSLANRKIFDRLGLYDNKMFVGLEDYELCIRGILSGKPVKARHIYDIEFIHDHCQSKRSKDRKTVFVRYDVNHVKASLKRITEKHNLILEGEWENWTANQAEKLLRKDIFTLKRHFERRRLISDHYFRAARKLLKKDEKGASLKFIWKSIINNPSNYWAWVFLIDNFTNRDLVKVLRRLKRGLVGPKVS